MSNKLLPGHAFGYRVVGAMRPRKGNAPVSRSDEFMFFDPKSTSAQPFIRCRMSADGGIVMNAALAPDEWENLVGSNSATKLKREIFAESNLHFIVMRPSFERREELVRRVREAIATVVYSEEDEDGNWFFVLSATKASNILYEFEIELYGDGCYHLRRGEYGRAVASAKAHMCMQNMPGKEAFALLAFAHEKAGEITARDSLLQAALNSGKQAFRDHVDQRVVELRSQYP